MNDWATVWAAAQKSTVQETDIYKGVPLVLIYWVWYNTVVNAPAIYRLSTKSFMQLHTANDKVGGTNKEVRCLLLSEKAWRKVSQEGDSILLSGVRRWTVRYAVLQRLSHKGELLSVDQLVCSWLFH